MTVQANKTTIIMAEDDEDDRMMIREALKDAGVHVTVHCVENGEELLAFLQKRVTDGANREKSPPAFILLDLNMPKLDGRKTLRMIRQSEHLKKIPIIVFTTSSAHEDIAQSYESGANSFILKPSSYVSMVDIMKTLKSYWLDTVSLPV